MRAAEGASSAGNRSGAAPEQPHGQGHRHDRHHHPRPEDLPTTPPRPETRSVLPRGLEVEGKVTRRREALLGVLLQAAPRDPLQRFVRARERRRPFLEHRGQDLGPRLALEGTAPAQHLVEQAAEGENVRAGVGRPPSHLFGRHVAGSAHDDPGVRCRGDGFASSLGPRKRDLSEVEELHLAVCGEEHVVRLEVAVDDPFLVGNGERSSDLDGAIEGSPGAGQGGLLTSRSRRVWPSSNSVTA